MTLGRFLFYKKYIIPVLLSNLVVRIKQKKYKYEHHEIANY